MANSPAAQALLKRAEAGGAWSLDGIHAAAHPFVVALLHRHFPRRTLVVVTAGVKAQESFHQDLATWVRESSKIEGRGWKAAVGSNPQISTRNSQPLFFPAWDILPHESKLPHVDVISERLETLVALAEGSQIGAPVSDPARTRARNQQAGPEAGAPSSSHLSPHPAQLVVANVVALMQRTFPPGTITQRTRTLRPGQNINPLDLVEWLEDEGYEPEAQVNSKGEIALRGGILDIFPPTSPWPLRVEFFGDEIESIREFDPATQLSKEPVEAATLAPAGELGILKRLLAGESRVESRESKAEKVTLATLLDYLPSDALVIVCEPERVNHAATDYAVQVPKGDAFFVSWEELQEKIAAQPWTFVELQGDTDDLEGRVSRVPDLLPELEEENDADSSNSSLQAEQPIESPSSLRIEGLEAFRPITERAVDMQIAEAQRREFFAQLHRWLRQGRAVHVFCNTEGEGQRFGEVWDEYGLGREAMVEGRAQKAPRPSTLDSRPSTHLGTLARGFIFEDAKLIVVTDAEIFGRYKVQRPRRLKSPHAATSRSALDIDFTEFEEGDYVVHVQHGIGRFLGLQVFESEIGRAHV